MKPYVRPGMTSSPGGAPESTGEPTPESTGEPTGKHGRADTGERKRGGYSHFPSDEAILRFLALPYELKLQWVWEMNALLAQAPPETRRLHELFRRGEI